MTPAGQLQGIFGDRLKMVATFGPGSHTCAIVDNVTMADLDACASAFGKSKTAPLLMLLDELSRALDAFPLELNEIISTRRIIAGTDVLAGLTVPTEDLRRACEAHARGHLLHLREGYMEAAGDRKAVSRLVTASVEPFGSLVTSVARLDGSSADALRSRLGISSDRDFPSVLRAAELLVDHVDRWRHA